MDEVLDRRRVHERRLERLGSLRPVGMATNGGQVCTSLDRTFSGVGPNCSEFTYIIYFRLVRRVLTADAFNLGPDLIDNTLRLQ